MKSAVSALVVGALMSMVAVAATAQSYPSRPIQFYVAFAPGGVGDLVARLVAKKMSESMGQPVVVENRPAPLVAVTTVKNAKPDGYSILQAGSGTALTNGLFKTLPYDLMKDFVHVSSTASFDLALFSNPNGELKSVRDVIAYAKKNPGKLNIGTARIGSTQNLTAEMFIAMAGVDAVIIPYRTTGDMLTAVLSGDIQVAFETIPPILGQVQGNSVKAIGVTSLTRFPGLPSVPTLAESGVAGFDAGSWNGVSVPAKTPPEVVARLEREIAAAIASLEVRQGLEKLGMQPKASSSTEMTARMKADIAKWAAIIDKVGVEKK